MILLIQMTIQYSMEFDQAEFYKENYTFSALTIEIIRSYDCIQIPVKPLIIDVHLSKACTHPQEQVLMFYHLKTRHCVNILYTCELLLTKFKYC